ncbi:hypothetical protein EDD28_0489 [Salana multivorans]|uniref:Uncharacterized protein n=1 Tax=Salana multivorans TaxID=120377 RepID=A0A3N2D818_9MICO|nr:hypothetical protein EDD28_0489 [Salana multivorans]
MAPTLDRRDGSGGGAVTLLDHRKTLWPGGRTEPVQCDEYRKVAYLRIEALRASRGRSQTRAER